jgi:hypothetical protein
MHHINGACTTYFNAKRERSGHLFQGRYKAILLEADEYAKQLSRYIHLNPLRAGMCTHPEEYPWSSCRYYTVESKAPGWLQRGFILGYFGQNLSVSMPRYRDFIRAVMEEGHDNPLADLKHSVILGSGQFVAAIRDRFLKHKAQDRDLPALRRLLEKPSLDQIEQAVDAVLSFEPKLARQVKLQLCQRYSGMKLTEIGMRSGMGQSGVSQVSQRIVLKRSKDKKLRKIVERIEKNILF